MNKVGFRRSKNAKGQKLIKLITSGGEISSLLLAYLAGFLTLFFQKHWRIPKEWTPMAAYLQMDM